MAKAAKKAPPGPARTRRVIPTSVYLQDETRLKLEEMVADTGRSKSQIISSLIEGADGELLARLARISDDLSQLIA